MATYRQVHITFWQDPFIEELSAKEKYFYIYLMTNSKTKQCGAYEISMKLIKYETGLDQSEIDSFIKLLVDSHKIDYNKTTQEFLIVNWLKHNSFKSPKVKTCIEKEILTIKTERYINFINSIVVDNLPIDRLLIDYKWSNDTRSQEEKEKEKEYNKNNTNVSDEPKPDDGPCPYKSVFDYYMTLDLISHRTYNKDMTKAIKKAMDTLKCDTEHLKKLLDRHKRKIEISSGTDYPIKVRKITEFFGQKKHNSIELICAEYDDPWQEPKREVFMKKSNDTYTPKANGFTNIDQRPTKTNDELERLLGIKKG